MRKGFATALRLSSLYRAYNGNKSFGMSVLDGLFPCRAVNSVSNCLSVDLSSCMDCSDASIFKLGCLAVSSLRPRILRQIANYQIARGGWDKYEGF